MSTQPSSGRSLARRLFMAALDREERGYPPAATLAPVHPSQYPPNIGSVNSGEHSLETAESAESRAKRLAVATTDSSFLVPPNDKLLVFRALTGIDTVPALTILPHLPRTAPNVGIYTRVVLAETKAAKRYRFHAFLINTCLSIQIVVAAALTALGAASGPHTAVTAFGAINTIMAGILTYLKGSGLPDRLKHYQNEWRNVREYIEQRERELCLDGCEIDVEEEVYIIEQMYDGVKREIQATKSGGESRMSNDRHKSRRSILPTHRSEREEMQDRASSLRTPERVYEKQHM